MILPDTSKMTIYEFYDTVGGDIADVVERLEDIDIVESYILDFEEDTSYSELMQSIDKSDLKGAFRAAHTLKGICYNFGFDRLGKIAAFICEGLRDGVFPTEASLHRLTAEYDCVYRAICCLKNNR